MKQCKHVTNLAETMNQCKHTEIIVWYLIIQISGGLGNHLTTITFNTVDPGKGDAGSTTNIYQYYTRLSSYGIVPYKEQYLTFKVKSCSNTFILLSSVSDLISADFYEIGLGVNNNYWYFNLRKKFGNDIMLIYEPNILNCNEYRPLWLSWSSGKICVGRGAMVGVDTFLNWTDPADPIDVTAIGVLSSWGTSGQWIFESNITASGGYSRCGSEGQRASMQLLETSLVVHRFECAMLCNLNEHCMGYSINTATMECELVEGNQLISKIADNNWKFYTKCLDGMSRCVFCP